MRVHWVIHEDFEAPGAFVDWARSRGHELTYSRVYLNDPLPESVDGIDLLVVMGGPQSPDTTVEECPHFDAAAEIALIKLCIDADKAVVGVCLGAQLIGESLGATFEHSPNKEIGVFPITMTAEGRSNPKFAHLRDEILVGHWHNDMPGLTPDSRVLATSRGCPRQIVEYSPLVYGLQCHMEFTPEVIEGLIAHSETDLEQYRDLPYVQLPELMRAHDYTAMNQALFDFLDQLQDEILG